MKRLVIKKLLLLTLVYIVLLCGVHMLQPKPETNSSKQEFLVTLNELEQLSKQHVDERTLSNTFQEARANVQASLNPQISTVQYGMFSYDLLLTITYLIAVFGYLYWNILRPFQLLEAYAERIAGGDLDCTLEVKRTNFFGAFTWAFDHMRKELQYAKAKQLEAIQENKTIIATLSHDIKTPIASIRAYAEGLEANLDGTYEQRSRYISVIMKKCDEVSRLTNDLMLHSLSELDHLEINKKPCDIGMLTETVLADLEDPQLNIIGEIPHKVLSVDEKRFAQILENICNNARKYASNQPIHIWAEVIADGYVLHIKDHGTGIPPEDLPFVFHKFYRGNHVGDEEGSGLGLYIVKTLLTQMNGDIKLINHLDGLEVSITLYE